MFQVTPRWKKADKSDSSSLLQLQKRTDFLAEMASSTPAVLWERSRGPQHDAQRNWPSEGQPRRIRRPSLVLVRHSDRLGCGDNEHSRDRKHERMPLLTSAWWHRPLAIQVRLPARPNGWEYDLRPLQRKVRVARCC